ncbi:MAG: hypothetical protein HW377_1688, partial [Actinobacteria bacterium]|nr:hypothetical protein [Actinomycetota bacterium]
MARNLVYLRPEAEMTTRRVVLIADTGAEDFG